MGEDGLLDNFVFGCSALEIVVPAVVDQGPASLEELPVESLEFCLQLLFLSVELS